MLSTRLGPSQCSTTVRVVPPIRSPPPRARFQRPRAEAQARWEIGAASCTRARGRIERCALGQAEDIIAVEAEVGALLQDLELGPASGSGVHPEVQRLLDRQGEWPQQQSEAWWFARQAMLTASDVSAVLGTSPFATAESVLSAKVERTASKPENAPMRHGNKYEAEARQAYERDTRRTCVEFGLKPHDKYAWLGASPDGVTLSGRLVEIKCPYNRRVSLVGLKAKHYAQVQVSLEIFNLEVCDLVQYYKPTGGRAQRKFKKNGSISMIEVKRDRQWFEDNLPRMEAWYTQLKEESERRDSPPPVQSAE